MYDHLTAEQLEAFVQRRLPAQSLLRVSQHIAECDDCRNLAESLALSPASMKLLGASFGTEHTPHLQYEDLQADVDGMVPLDSSQRGHLADCVMCSREYNDLKQFAASLRDDQRLRPRWVRAVFSIGAVAAVVIFTVVLLGHREILKPRPVLTAELNDAGTRIGLDSAGRLQAPGNLTEDDRQLLADAIQSHRLNAPPAAEVPQGATEVFRGAPQGSPAFRVLSPQGESLETPLPTFRWQALPGALSYRVNVYDESYHRAAKSPPLSTTEWTPEAPLARGKTYMWSVEASVPGEVVQTAAQPGSEARFQILSDAVDARIEAVEHQNPNAHLLLAALLAKAGARSEARAQIHQLAVENPGSSLVQDLDSSLELPKSRR